MSEREFHFVVMVGSLRRASYSRAIAETLDELAPDDVAVRLLPSTRTLPHYDQDVEDAGMPPAAVAMGEAIAAADALVIVSPEYNRSIPGSLKNALDWLSRLPGRPLDGKSVAIQTSSPGRLGGVRAQQPLRDALAAMNARPLCGNEVVIAQVADKVSSDTHLLRDEGSRRMIAEQLRALAGHAA